MPRRRHAPRRALSTSRQAPATPARRPVPLAGLLAVLAVLLAGCASATAGTAADGRDDGDPAASREVSLRVDGRDRSYLLQPALGLDDRDRAALVVVLHQEGGTPEGVAAETELQDLRRRGATLAYPQGVDRSWDAGKCCGLPSRQRVDDVAFLDAVFRDAGKRTPVDPERTALVGYSSGGMLTYRYVCARTGRLAAAVVVSGSLESPCDDQLTVPDVLALHGKKDGTIGLNRPIFVKALEISPRPAASTLQIVTRQAGCSARPVRSTPALEVRTWDCRGGVIEARLVPDAGHGWSALDATRSTRDFLSARLLER